MKFGRVIPYSISDSIWLANGSLLVSAGRQMLLYGQQQKQAQDDPDANGEVLQEHLFEHVARRNGPLVDYDPQMLLECLLWEKVELVKQIIVNLAKDVERLRILREEGRTGADEFEWTTVPIESVMKKDGKTETKKVEIVR
jgi:hypothetical protein